MRFPHQYNLNPQNSLSNQYLLKPLTEKIPDSPHLYFQLCRRGLGELVSRDQIRSGPKMAKGVRVSAAGKAMAKSKKVVVKDKKEAARNDKKLLSTPSWTRERVEKLSDIDLMTLRDNAQKRDRKELVELCDQASVNRRSG